MITIKWSWSIDQGFLTENFSYSWTICSRRIQPIRWKIWTCTLTVQNVQTGPSIVRQLYCKVIHYMITWGSNLKHKDGIWKVHLSYKITCTCVSSNVWHRDSFFQHSAQCFTLYFQVQLFVTDSSWTKLNLQICDILSTEGIQCILKHYKLDHMKTLFKVFIEIIVIC